MSQSRRDLARVAGLAVASAAAGSALVACNGDSSSEESTTLASLTPDTLEKLEVALLNGHWPANSNTHMFPSDTVHESFLGKLFGDSDAQKGDIDDLLRNTVEIADAGQRTAVVVLMSRIPRAFAIKIYKFIHGDVNELRDCCDAETSHWY